MPHAVRSPRGAGAWQKAGATKPREVLMNYSEIKHFDIANGPGIRTSLFVSGCRLRCRGCFNAVAWSFSSGREFTAEVGDGIIRSVLNPFMDGITILGGEPTEPENQEGLGDFLEWASCVWASRGRELEDDMALLGTHLGPAHRRRHPARSLHRPHPGLRRRPRGRTLCAGGVRYLAALSWLCQPAHHRRAKDARERRGRVVA